MRCGERWLNGRPWEGRRRRSSSELRLLRFEEAAGRGVPQRQTLGYSRASQRIAASSSHCLGAYCESWRCSLEEERVVNLRTTSLSPAGSNASSRGFSKLAQRSAASLLLLRLDSHLISRSNPTSTNRFTRHAKLGLPTACEAFIGVSCSASTRRYHASAAQEPVLLARFDNRTCKATRRPRRMGQGAACSAVWECRAGQEGDRRFGRLEGRRCPRGGPC